MSKKGRRSGRKGHRKAEAKSRAQSKNKQHKGYVVYLVGRGIRMDILAYAAGALAGIVFVVAGFWYSEHKINAIVLVGIGVLFLDLATCLLWADKVIKATPAVKETEFSGVLLPANDPSPPNRCTPPPPEALSVFYGGSVAWSTHFPLTIVSITGKDLLSVRRDANGLSVWAKIFDAEGKIIADIENNEFTINQNNYFKHKRPDASTLIIYDQYDQPVLNVRFLNPAALRVLGVFRVKDRAPVIIEENRTLFGGSISTGDCAGGAHTVFQLN